MSHSEKDNPFPLTTQQETTALVVRVFRSASHSGKGMTLDARTAGGIADCIETLARLADGRAEGSENLKAHAEELYGQVSDLTKRFAAMSALIVQIRQ